jgi:hypothetical protein
MMGSCQPEMFSRGTEPTHTTLRAGLVQQPVQIVARLAITIQPFPLGIRANFR